MTNKLNRLVRQWVLEKETTEAMIADTDGTKKDRSINWDKINEKDYDEANNN